MNGTLLCRKDGVKGSSHSYSFKDIEYEISRSLCCHLSALFPRVMKLLLLGSTPFPPYCDDRHRTMENSQHAFSIPSKRGLHTQHS